MNHVKMYRWATRLVMFVALAFVAGLLVGTLTTPPSTASCTVWEDGSGTCSAPVGPNYVGPCETVIIGGPYEGECSG